MYAFFSFAYLLYSLWRFGDAARNPPDLFRKDFERNGVLRVILSMSSIEWKRYSDEKPSKQGHYLIVIEDATNELPRFGDVAYYHPVHGWSGSAHVLERAIHCWAKFPWPDLR